MKFYDIVLVAETAWCLDPVLVGYFTPWGDITTQQIPYDKVTHINYAFGALTNRTHPGQVSLDEWYDMPKLKSVIATAHTRNGNHPKVLLSIGGWTGSQMFSPMAKAREHRQHFINQAITFMKPIREGGLDLDGIDLDWEFPGRRGSLCNQVDPNDTENYLILLKEMRVAMDRSFKGSKLLTAAVSIAPFDDENITPRKDVSEFSKYFDFVNVMAYDFYGSWSATTGPNAPLHHHPKKGEPFSFSKALNAWKDAGFPASKIVGGLAFYGRTFEASESPAATSQFVEKTSNRIQGDASDVLEKSLLCDEGTFFSGVYKYKHLRKDILATPAPKLGYTRYNDNVTQTPYLYEPSSRRLITYDDPISIQAKASYIQDNGFGGAMIWEMSFDYQDELLDALRSVIIQPPIDTLQFNSPTEPTIPDSNNQPYPIPPITPPSKPRSHSRPPKRILETVNIKHIPLFLETNHPTPIDYFSVD
ncbi:hypothetical protein DSO57_1027352 [Entomophthora muscae]|uniref:Uncharacterized protein n=1 Tax=Entomophthora muscae TaxID=34485 RepID=A0ACC2TDZ3_9FUNG|nr:hypothetical protein DSO57_1027352 [Entomophthora muscae]